MSLHTPSARVMREFLYGWREENNSPCPIRIGLKDSSFSDLWAVIMGPPQSPYAGGTFRLQICIPKDYPYVGPKIRFVTKIWHPNVSLGTGQICLNAIEDSWDIVMNVRTLLLTIQVLLGSPVMDEPSEPIIAEQYSQNYEQFYQTAQYWTHVYANGPIHNPHFSHIVNVLHDRGVSLEEARLHLSKANWQLPNETHATFHITN